MKKNCTKHWICDCGVINYNEDFRCVRCNANKVKPKKYKPVKVDKRIGRGVFQQNGTKITEAKLKLMRVNCRECVAYIYCKKHKPIAKALGLID